MSELNRRIGLAWLMASALVMLCTASAMNTDAAANAASTVFTNGRDLGIIAGVVVAFMLIVWLIVAGESRRRERSSRMVADSLSAQSFSLAQSIHNIIEHNTQMSVAADKRLSEFMEFARGRPCFMAEDARDLLRESSRKGRIIREMIEPIGQVGG